MVAIAPPRAVAADTRVRILEGAYACVARVGLAKTSVEAVAREAGVARATVYRHFPGGRDEVVTATVDHQVERFFVNLRDHVDGAGDLHELLVEGLAWARAEVAGHSVLEAVLATEAEQVVPAVEASAARFVPAVVEFLVPWVEAAPRRAGIDPVDAASYLARMVLSTISAPGRWDLTDRRALERLVQRQMLAGILTA